MTNFNFRKFLSVFTLFLAGISLSACADVINAPFDQKIVDESGPAPVWVTSPERARRLAFSKGDHLYIGKSTKDNLSDSQNSACQKAEDQALESNPNASSSRVSLTPTEQYWKRSRGLLGDKFHSYCLIRINK